MLPANLATAMIVNVRDAKEDANLEKMMKRLKNPKIFLNFDATFAEENDVADAVVMTTAPANQRMSLVSQKMVPVNLATTIPDEARKTANHEKIRLPPKHQKMILNFDATLAANATDVEDAVVMMTAPANQKMPLASQKMPPVTLVTMTTVNDAKVAREAASHEKMTRKRRKKQKIFLSSDATFAKASDAVDDVVVAEVMTTALVSQRTLLVNLVMIAKIVENVEVVLILMTLMN